MTFATIYLRIHNINEFINFIYESNYVFSFQVAAFKKNIHGLNE